MSVAPRSDRGPHAQQRRLAKSGGRAGQCQPALHHPIEPIDEPRARGTVGACRRNGELRRQKGLLL
jgi:hypothetical protein